MEKLINGVLLTRETVLVEHEGLVHVQCRKLKHWAKSLGHDYEDIESVGNIGLINAFDRFDSVGYDNRFSTFATPQIWGEIQKYLSHSDDGIRYTRNIKETAHKIKRLELEDLSVDEIAKELKVTVGRVGWALDYLKNGSPARLDKLIGDEENEFSGLFGAPDDKTGIYVSEFLNTLSTLERDITIQLMAGVSGSDIARMRGCGANHVGNVRKRVREKYGVYSNL